MDWSSKKEVKGATKIIDFPIDDKTYWRNVYVGQIAAGLITDTMKTRSVVPKESINLANELVDELYPEEKAPAHDAGHKQATQLESDKDS